MRIGAIKICWYGDHVDDDDDADGDDFDEDGDLFEIDHFIIVLITMGTVAKR